MKNNYKIEGDTTILYAKWKGKTYEVFISTADLELVKEFPNYWSVHMSSGKPYIRGRIQVNNVRKAIGIHQWILGTQGIEGVMVDHIDHNTFNNRRSNLRPATVSQNGQNRRGAVPGTRSGIRGVSWNEYMGKWKANVWVNGVSNHLGYYEDPEEAGRVAKEARVKLMTHAEN